MAKISQRVGQLQRGNKRTAIREARAKKLTGLRGDEVGATPKRSAFNAAVNVAKRFKVEKGKA